MKISTRGRYALRIMLDIALHGDKGPVSFKEVSEREGISVKYMEQIGSILTRSGFLKSVRGAKGGYNLTRKPSEYTVGDILRATEGELNIAPCLDEGACDRTSQCMTHELWLRMNNALMNVVDNTTLQDLIDSASRKVIRIDGEQED